MSKKDYELIAAAIREEYTALDPEEPSDDRARHILRLTTERLAEGFEAANPRFDTNRFLRRAYGEDGA